MPKRRSLQVHPLDEILGSRANVAVLRAICRHVAPRWPVEITAETKLSRASVWNALYRLRQLGVIDVVGAWQQGTSVPFRLRHEHPLALPIFGLFLREESFQRGG